MKQTRKPVHPGEVFFRMFIPPGLSVVSAASMMKITRKALSEFVNGKSACSPQMALRIAGVTHTRVNRLLLVYWFHKYVNPRIFPLDQNPDHCAVEGDHFRYRMSLLLCLLFSGS